MSNIWGIDLGGTKIEGAILDAADNWRVLARLRVPTEQQHGYQHIIGQIKKLVDQLTEVVGTVPATLPCSLFPLFGAPPPRASF